MSKNITFHTSNLIIRPFTIDDVSDVYKLSQEEGMIKHLPDQVYGSVDETSRVIQYLIAQYRELQSPISSTFILAVELTESNTLVGHVGLSPTKGGFEIGYAIAESEQGQGYATEIVKKMTQWALNVNGLPFIFGIVDSENIASCRVLEKSGFQLIEENKREAFGRYCLCRIYRINAS